MKKNVTLVIVSLVIGTFVTLQAKTFQSIGNVLVGRDSHANIFQEIQLLIQTNTSLKHEISELTDNLSQLSNRASALSAIGGEINKYRVLDGQVEIKGPGLEISISENVATIWLVDLVNELFSIGAEAVSINDIRLTNYTHGFDTLPQGQILLNGNILQTPLLLKAIGDPATLQSILEQPKGILDKLYGSNSKLDIKIVQKGTIEIAEVI